MDSPQSVMSPFKSCAIFTEPEKQNTELFLKNSSGGISARREDLIGLIDVYIHQARDIHNICIYQKQDVYAKLCLTSDPDNALSTKIINGGGKNPVFNENLRLNVRTMECCVKCEIWMMSRVRNYMEDQLLGFALVPLSEVLLGNGKLEKEFSLSSTDLFHSPAGFVHLSLSYNGTLPELISISAEKTVQNAEVMLESLANEFEKIEFPDPKIMNENDVMVSEYFGIQGSTLESQTSDSLVSSSDNENQPSPDVGESFPSGNMDSPPSSVCVSTNESHPASSQSSETPGASKTAPEEYISPSKECAKEKSLDDRDAEESVFPKAAVMAVNIEAEQKVVQQDIIDMYMKSMQQFTESLAKMKLPLELESTTTSSGNSSSDQKSQTPKSSGSRVFYGSRAFF
ncbi:PREDICTED: uncharacterized protein LOC109190838 [Ipomoea nil]|uniref:uncharacterized protein LOC109190838 n=1 Tax=Ipomoea nil TaxID=35883 RepID=UPI0009018543|nr:PREDICTED: uncharacterized protein LOC109190838 [Ipomoea nil]XP_019197014.1 PREDICTED: uncharacterized protein LOC109190838 [Ipomoea nil]XP_019197015.1 PREDICTED: uncharacterized protein LOC109190838 [Ipomoea nil]